jgi:hypothetical protein
LIDPRLILAAGAAAFALWRTKMVTPTGLEPVFQP